MNVKAKGRAKQRESKAKEQSPDMNLILSNLRQENNIVYMKESHDERVARNPLLYIWPQPPLSIVQQTTACNSCWRGIAKSRQVITQGALTV
jgi:hypothetical protein